jgi:hypothetical protein
VSKFELAIVQPSYLSTATNKFMIFKTKKRFTMQLTKKKKKCHGQLSQLKETSALFNSGIFETLIINSTEQAKEHLKL